MANCPQCGTRILPGALACINCQRPVDPETAATAVTGEAPPPPGPAPYAMAGPQPPPAGYPPQQYVGPVPYAPGYYPQGPTPWSNNGMAIASLVLAILWLGGIGSILGVVFGHVARRQLARRPQRGGGLAIAGLIIGYLGIAGSIALYASIPSIVHSGTVQSFFVREDIRDAATAEDSYHHDFGRFTADGSSLRAEDWSPIGDNTIAVGVNGALGYCIVGTHDGTNNWYLYDSAAGGLSDDVTYPAQSEAEQACIVPNVSSYSVIN
jgi:hypothetical protein